MYQAVSKESILCNWEVGMYVSNKLKTVEWGSETVEKLWQYIRGQLPGEKGYDRKNLYRMVQFVEIYMDDEFVTILSFFSKVYFIKNASQKFFV